MLGVMVATSAWLVLAIHRLTAVEIPGSFDWPPNLWPTLFDFPLTDYALIGAIGLASFGVAVASVARQRHGDAQAVTPRTVDFPGFPEDLVNLFRFPCPTSSATRAQVWFEMKSSGVPVLAIGLVLAISNPLVFAITRPIEFAHPYAVGWAMLSVLFVLIQGVNAFGFRWRQGRAYASAFESTQPYGTARLAGLKVLVRSVCVLPALIAVGLSVWASLSFILGANDEKYLRSGLRVIEGAVGAMTGYQQVALAVVACIGVAVMVASVAGMHGARGTLSPSPEHRDVPVPVVLGSRARPAGAGRTPRDRIALRTDTLDRRTGDCARDGLPLLEGVRGATADAALRRVASFWSRRHSGRHG